jgi:tetratricopeptide (TPR) repeat protein
MLIKVQEIDQAINLCNEIIRSRPIVAEEAYFILGDAYISKCDYEIAKAYYTKVKDPYRAEKLNFKLGKLELKRCNYKEAENYFNNIKDEDSVWYNRSKYFKAIISFKTGDYEKTKEILKTISVINGNIYIKNRLEGLRFYMDHYLSQEIKETDVLKYNQKQIINYSKERALDHIMRRHVDEKNNKSTFSKNINVEELFEDIQTKLIDKYKIGDDYVDKYCIPYPNIGYSEAEKLVHELEVITLPNTKNIITMYPKNYNKEESIELSYNQNNGNENSNNKSKVKRLSQVDKFYARYGKR